MSLMDEEARRIIESLVAMAKADGEVSGDERKLLAKVLIEAGAVPADSTGLNELLEDMIEAGPLTPSLEALSEDKRLNVMRALLIMSFMDGKLSFSEFHQLEQHQKTLGLSDIQVEILRAEANEAARLIQKDLS